MTQEDKELLLKDLCARLPYGVKAFVAAEEPPITICSYEAENTFFDSNEWEHNVESVKPYLRPMSSMTDEEDARRCAFLDDIEGGIENAILNYIDWLISNHFDYRGLIQMGLALEAPEDMYK